MSSNSRAIDSNRPGFLTRSFPTFARWCGNMGWPILQRQLRADFRKTRFFMSQFLCLSLLGGALIIVITHQAAEESRSSTQIGQGLFDMFFLVEYLIILVIFPAFSSTAFTEERAGLTMDLLLVSTLRPVEIVSGKLLASAVYCLIYVVATLPLLSVSFLFGGVELSEVLMAYAILIAMTLLVSMLGVAVSSGFSSSVRSTIVTYTVVFGLLALSGYVYTQVAPEQSAGAQRTLIGGIARWEGLGYSLSPAHLGWLLVVVFVYLFLITANQVRPASDDRSSPMRVLTLLCFFGFIGVSLWPRLGWTGGAIAAITTSTEWFDDLIQQTAIFLLTLATVFPTEEANVSRRNRARFARWTGTRYILRPLAPGAFWGGVYTVTVAVTGSALLLAVWRSSFASFAGSGQDARVTQSLLSLPLYVAAFSALGFFLAASDFTPVYSRLSVIFLFVISLLVPVIHMLSKAPETVWTNANVIWRGYYLSPITLWASLDWTNDDRSQFVLFGCGIIHVGQIILAAITLVFLAGGVLMATRSGYPLIRFGPIKSSIQPLQSRPAHRPS